jgi:hypothetical protein
MFAFLATLLVYWGVACRRVYGFGPLRSAASAAVFFAAMLLSHFTYRFVQFLLAFALT